MVHSDHADGRDNPDNPDNDEQLDTPTDPPDKAAGLRRQAETAVLGDAIAELAARIQAATYELLVMIHEFDERGGWGQGFRSCAHWLNWRTGIAMGPAREKVRVARALAKLPRLSAEMRRGALSYSKVRALTRVATPDTEERLLGFSRYATAAHVERLVRAWRRVDRITAAEDDRRRHEGRHLEVWVDEDGMLVVRGRLSPEVGAVVQRALEAASDRLYHDTDDKSEVSVGQRRADALGLVAESALSSDLDRGTAGDRYHVVVHVDADELGDNVEAGQAVLESGAGGRVAPGGCPPGAPTDPDVPNSGIRLLGLRIRCAAVAPAHTRLVRHPRGVLARVAIFRCFVKMVSRLDVRGICPSGSSVHRPPPSLHGVPWGGFPHFTGTMQRLRRLASPRRFVAFARRFHPDASCFAPCTHGRHASRARTISSAAPVDRVSRMESTRPPRFLGNPPVYMPRSSTPADPTTLATAGRAMLPSAQKTASAPQSVSLRGSITRPAHALCTLRSRGRPRTTQHSVPAGAYPLPDRTFTCRVPLESFRHVHLLHGFPFLQASPGAISAETSRRMACDASRVVMTHARDGSVLDVGRKTRTIPPAIRRALASRNRDCRFPGCDASQCDAHHIRHWADGGATRLDNLVLLCRRHHRAVHEEGFTVELRNDGEARFFWPDGRPLPAAPPAPTWAGAALTSTNAHLDTAGLSIGPRTATPDWCGERLDLDWAITVLHPATADPVHRDVPAGTRALTDGNDIRPVT